MAQFCRKYITYFIFASAVCIGVVSALNRPLGLALIILTFLVVVTVLGLLKAGFREKELYILFFAAVFVYLIFAIFIYYTQFYPFGGGEGDQWWNQRAAVAISNDFWHGDFSFQHVNVHLAENYSANIFPVLLAVLYAITMPSEIIGILFVVWFAALSFIVLYLLARELGAFKKYAFIVAFIGVIYPSFLYFSGLLLRESMVVALFLFVLLLIVKIIKQFSWLKFLVAYIALGLLISIRFYVGFAVLYSFVLILPWLRMSDLKTKLSFIFTIFFLLGFLPQMFGHGYYGFKYAKNFLVPRQIMAYREFPVKLHSAEVAPQTTSEVLANSPLLQVVSQSETEQKPKVPGLLFPRGEYRFYDEGSTIIVRGDIKNPVAFAKSYLISFVYVLLGPFPWQIRYVRQVFTLAESIPWLFLFFFIAKGAIRQRRNYRLFLPVLFASFGLIAAIALLINNYGTFMRIRIPAFLALLSLLPFAFQKKETEKSKQIP